MTGQRSGSDPTRRALVRDELPAEYERWRLELAAGVDRPTDAGEWAGALVLIEQGVLEVDCAAGGSRTFVAGDLLALGWLPLVRLRSVGREPVRLLAVRRREARPSTPFLHVGRIRRDRLRCDR